MSRPLTLAFAAGAVMLLIGSTLAARAARTAQNRRSAESLRRAAPGTAHAEEFVTSASCQACHPAEYASWHRSYHRTMTTVASPETIRGRFDGSSLELGGRSYTVERRGDEHWVRFPDPAEPDEQAVERRVVMVTGSHHMQLYWTAGDAGRLESFAFAYLLGDKRWAPNQATLLRPPEPEVVYTWNRVCIRCHAVAGQPGYDPRTGHTDTASAELGIACEACHGPGREHVRRNRNPVRRYRHHLSAEPDPTIVHPERLSGHESAAVCGQCHSISLPRDEQRWLTHGSAYRAGADLHALGDIVRHPARATIAAVTDVVQADATYLGGRFWSDGMVRVTGREYNGLIESPCYASEELSCVSCHSMHDAEPDDQLTPIMRGDEACLQCHEELRESIADHSKHPAGSSGSRCYNCHMPHTTYGLLKAVRSHQVDSPSVRATVSTGRPNACNLCHLDRPLQWTADALAERFGQDPITLDAPQRDTSAASVWLLQGDAGQRALAAWHMAWPPAVEAAGDHWQAPLLAELLDDPYPAVRFIAEHALRRLPGFGDLAYDYVGPSEHRRAAVVHVRELWGAAEHGDPTLVQRRDGKLDIARLRSLLAARDDRPVDLKE